MSKLNKSIEINKQATVKSLSILLIASAIFAQIFSVMSNGQPMNEEQTMHFVYENISRGFVVAAVIFAISLILSTRKNYLLYWPILSKEARKSADERQKRVRQRVYEKSYGILAVVFVALSIFLDTSTQSGRSYFFWTFIFLLLVMPAVIAANQKDS
jgi:cytochrome bd-type quinol oxidase subunit 2